jgi:hypothetical protein
MLGRMADGHETMAEYIVSHLLGITIMYLYSHLQLVSPSTNL